jgi:fructose-1-phosphate kinase PfkB-like protein
MVIDALRENEVNRVREHYLDASGKGVNAARVLVQLGERAAHLTQVGGRDGELFSQLVGESGVELIPVSCESSVRYGHTLISSEARTTTEIIEEGRPVGAGVEERVVDAFRDALEGYDAVIILGSKAPGFSPELFPTLVRDCRDSGIPCVLDYRGEDLRRSLEHGPLLIKPNFSEFAKTFLDEDVSEQASRGDPEVRRAVEQRMEEIARQSGAKVIVTRGSAPSLYTEGRGVYEMPTERLRPRNTIGCGDAYTAAAGRALVMGDTLEQAARAGTAAAAANARALRPGTIR